MPTRKLDERREKIQTAEAECARLNKTLSRLRTETHDLEAMAQKYHSVRGEVERLEGQAGPGAVAGSATELVYKPRSVALEASWNHLLRWLAARGSPRSPRRSEPDCTTTNRFVP